MFHMGNTMGTNTGTRTAYPFGTHEILQGELFLRYITPHQSETHGTRLIVTFFIVFIKGRFS
jgi:hypothetical protein